MKVATTVTLVLAMTTLSGLALAWKRQASIDVGVHAHRFTKVLVENTECTLRYRLDFSAPPEAYAKTKHPHRFRARLKLEDGRFVTSPVFDNRTPGDRAYTQTYDTSAEGCWASREHKLFGVDVEGCRGQGCTPDAFD